MCAKITKEDFGRKTNNLSQEVQMSVIVAIKKNGVIYMGADSQCSKGYHRSTLLNDIGFKIAKLDNGILMGFCGRVATMQSILAIKDLFTLDENNKLTKKHIVTQIIPKIMDKFDEIGNEKYGAITGSILLAHQDKLYRITSGLDVLSINNAVSIGAGMDFAHHALYCMPDAPVNERLLSALEESANWVESVDGPFVLNDTQNLQYKIVSAGGAN